MLHTNYAAHAWDVMAAVRAVHAAALSTGQMHATALHRISKVRKRQGTPNHVPETPRRSQTQISDSDVELLSSEEPDSSPDNDSDYVLTSEDEESRARAPKRGAGSAGRKSAGGSGGGGSAVRRPAAASKPAKRARLAGQPKLPDLLKSASKEQLISLVLELNGNAEGELEERIAELLPPPDLTGIKASVLELERKMNKAFPHAKYGSNRDNYAYKRVGPAQRDLKAALLEHAHMLNSCKRYDSLLSYLIFALGVADNMPHWDAPAHNKVKEQAAKQLEGMFVKAVKAARPSEQGLERLRGAVEGMELPLPAARAAVGASA